MVKPSGLDAKIIIHFKKNPMLELNETTLQNFSAAREFEWLETNGLGGYSSSSVTHAHTRRYHGILVAATRPPVERMVLLSKMEETIVTGNGVFELGCNQFGNTVIPKGNQFLLHFSKKIFPQWEYEIDGVVLKKTIFMVHGENTVAIIYDVVKSPSPFRMEILPLVAARSYHSLNHAGPQMHWDYEWHENIFHNKPDGVTNLYIKVPNANFTAHPDWYYNFNYSEEKNRGLDYEEDLFSHGIFSVSLKEGDSLGIIISTTSPGELQAHDLLAAENLRRQILLNDQPSDEVISTLVLAADQFIVERDEDLRTVIAGYHWFTDWARDTMISLAGLALSTGRPEDAKKILSAFAKTVSMGMLPNRFQDENRPPEYNNVDGTLWYFIAVHKYLRHTNDSKFVLDEILPVLKEIIDWHFRGTRFNIHVDEDGLLYAGETGMQLTWMDAKVGDWVVTPRMGKPVEIQALWYNALRIFAQLLELNNQDADAEMVHASAEKARESFEMKFWFEEGKYLFDNIDDHGIPDASLRPNQIFAVSLPYSLITGEKAASLLNIVEASLYTPVGLRTLPETDSRYAPVYEGDVKQRDSAYHQGTVWSWLLGPYIDTVVKVRGVQGMNEARNIIEAFRYHLDEACPGSVSEIFDGAPPHHPRGCIAQAWGVAEVLRVIKEYNLVVQEGGQLNVELEKKRSTSL
ncbi:MAG: glycogen debranching protein [Bacteroidetes bacterium]|nr:MAG: glycogen debranching protein [Bacteroidota bacterium]